MSCLEGGEDTYILFLDRGFLEMVSLRHRKGLLMKLHLHVTGHNWSYGLESDDEVDLEELRETGLALDFVLDNIKQFCPLGFPLHVKFSKSVLSYCWKKCLKEVVL